MIVLLLPLLSLLSLPSSVPFSIRFFSSIPSTLFCNFSSLVALGRNDLVFSGALLLETPGIIERTAAFHGL